MTSPPTPHRPARPEVAPPPAEYVWYAAYGSNMHAYRLGYYLKGGRPPHGTRTYPGCRDATPPSRTLPVVLAGQLYFALESRQWTGGLGLYDPLDPGETPGRAYLVTVPQFSDLVAQEMAAWPGCDLDLTEVIETGTASLGPGRYETLVCPGWLDGFPVLTFTAPWRRADVAWNAPSPAYLRHLGSGLVEAHGWRREQVGDYLSGCSGAAGVWSAEAIAALLPEAGFAG
ncbi:histone deacetylase [Yinghuangia sp. ASG 101]|uniref:histone deacetylase n=1 Tax=Yinghuangia sp. ASG 101 TaxID=2896848 RepID=UPI003FCC6A09